jgi:hypothetical protein
MAAIFPLFSLILLHLCVVVFPFHCHKSVRLSAGIRWTMLICALVAFAGAVVSYFLTPTYDASMLVQEGQYLPLDHVWLRPSEQDMKLRSLQLEVVRGSGGWGGAPPPVFESDAAAVLAASTTATGAEPDEVVGKTRPGVSPGQQGHGIDEEMGLSPPPGSNTFDTSNSSISLTSRVTVHTLHNNTETNSYQNLPHDNYRQHLEHQHQEKQLHDANSPLGKSYGSLSLHQPPPPPPPPLKELSDSNNNSDNLVLFGDLNIRRNSGKNLHSAISSTSTPSSSPDKVDCNRKVLQQGDAKLSRGNTNDPSQPDVCYMVSSGCMYTLTQERDDLY